MSSTFNIFYIDDEDRFINESLKVFFHQWENNIIYRDYCDAIGCIPSVVKHYRDIPFLPVNFFKIHTVACKYTTAGKVFVSSGTTGQQRSRHIIHDIEVYHKSLEKTFNLFYGPLDEYEIFALMPDPVENPDSSLIYMVNRWIELSGVENSGFFLNDQESLARRLNLTSSGKKRILIGLTYSLLDFAEKYEINSPRLIIMETGGMKGRRKEMIRNELHDILRSRFNVENIHSEYGMTELLSQSYSHGNGKFRSPPWKKILIRDPQDPLAWTVNGKSGGINIVDLANYNSCSFIATQDLGRTHPDGSFEVLGRFDDSDVRGCNLMMI